jgi:hypothetical protein
MTMRRPALLVFLLSLSSAVFSEPLPALSGHGEAPVPFYEPTYYWLTNNVFPICMYCHIAVPGVYFGRYQDTLKHVVPGSAENSRLYIMVRSGRMPKGRAKLGEHQIMAIRDWIDNGALNN